MAEHSVTVENTLQTLLTDKKYSTIRDILVTMNPADIAAVFAGVEPDKLPLLFRLLRETEVRCRLILMSGTLALLMQPRVLCVIRLHSRMCLRLL